VFFNADCNEQVFSPKPRKNFSEDPSCRFREKRKKRLIPTYFSSEKMTSPSRSLED